MNNIEKRKIQEWLNTIHNNYQAGWGEHELHDQLVALSKYIESVKHFDDLAHAGFLDGRTYR